MADVRWHVTARRGCQPSEGIQSLNESGDRQRPAPRRSHLDAGRLQEDPWNRVRTNRGGTDGPGPDGARVPGVHPSGAHDAIRERDRAELERVGAEEMAGELLSLVAEQRGLRREQCPGDASERSRRLAHVVLCADAATEEESLVPRRHPNVIGHRRRRDTLRLRRLRQRNRESHAESREAPDKRDAPRDVPCR